MAISELTTRRSCPQTENDPRPRRTPLFADVLRPCVPPSGGLQLLLSGSIAVFGMILCGGLKRHSRLLALLFAFLAAPVLLSLSGCDNDCDDNASKCAQTSSAAATSAAIKASQNPAIAGQPITFTGTITSRAARQPEPSPF